MVLSFGKSSSARKLPSLKGRKSTPPISSGRVSAWGRTRMVGPKEGSSRPPLSGVGGGGGRRAAEPAHRNHQLAALEAGADRDGVAAARQADGRDIDDRGAILADDVAAFVVVALGAADLAGVERRGQRPVGPADDEEARRRVPPGEAEAVQVAVVDLRRRQGGFFRGGFARGGGAGDGSAAARA